MKEANVTTPGQTEALSIRPAQEVGTALPASDIKAPITAAQAKVEAVANLTMKAYEMASTLKLTPEEVSSLQQEFPDEAFKPGAAGKENLIYIEHAFLRDRLNQVFGPGQWAIIPRNRWAEPFTTGRGTEGSRVYVEAMLVIRGAFVAEAVGAMEYYPKNESQNYGDAVEGAKTAALRRCAKELGIGLQAWKQDWCNGWWARKRGQKTPPKPATPPPAKAPPPASPPTRPMQPAVFADADTRTRLINGLEACRDLAKEYFEKIGALLPTETLEDLPLRFVPITKKQFQALQGAIAAFGNGEEALQAFLPNPDRELPPEAKPKPAAPPPTKTVEPPPKAAAPPPPPASRAEKGGNISAPSEKRGPEWFFTVVCPIPNKGQKRSDYLLDPDTILSLYRRMKEGDEAAQKRLWGFASHWQPEARTVGNKTYEPSKEDHLFREALDSFVEWEQKHGKDREQEPELAPRPAGVTRHQEERRPHERDNPDPEEDDVPF